MSPKAAESIAIDTGASEPERIRLLDGAMLRGCNVYHRAAVFRQRIDLGMLAGLDTGAADRGFAGRFAARFAALDKVPRREGMSAPFLARLSSARGVRFEEALLEAILAVELSIAFRMRRLEPIEYAATFGTAGTSVDFVWQSESARLSRGAARAAVAGVEELLPDHWRSGQAPQGGTFGAELDALRRRALRRQRSMTAAVLTSAARQRGLPCEPLGDAYLVVGQGIAQQVISSTTLNAAGPSAPAGPLSRRAVHLALAAAGLPVPEQLEAESRDQVLAAARQLRYPVVVKPLNGRCGAGVSVDVRGTADLLPAYNRARRRGPLVLVESFVAGPVYRLLVVGGRVVAAARLAPPRIVGDGERSLAALIEAQNASPGRDGLRLMQIRVDHELEASLGRRGYRLTDVPARGQQLVVQPLISAAFGAVPSDVTDAVHAAYRDLAVRAAAALGLDVAGVDLVTADITRPQTGACGTIVDVSDRPDLGLHAVPAFGQPRDVGGAVLELSFPAGTQATVPTALIVGRRGTFRAARELEGILRAAGRVAALATHRHTRIGGEPVTEALARRDDAARLLLRDPRVETLVMTAAPRRVARRGLRIDACTVTAIMDTRGGDPGLTRRGLEVAARAASGVVVVSADDPFAPAALQAIEAQRLVLLDDGQGTALVRRHVRTGGAVLRRLPDERRIVIEGRDGAVAVISTPRADAPREDELGSRGRLVAVALAFGLGLPAHEIEAALKQRAALGR